MKGKIKAVIIVVLLLAMSFIGSIHLGSVFAQETVFGTQDDTLGVWMFSAGTTIPAGAPTDDIIGRAVFYNLLDYIGDTSAEVYKFSWGPVEPVTGQEDKTLAEVVRGLSAIDDFGYLANAGDDDANFDTGRNGYFVGGFDPKDPFAIVADGVKATGLLGPSEAASKEQAEEAIKGYEIFIFEDAELSGMVISLSNRLGLNMTFSIADLQVNPPTQYGADDTLVAIDLDALPGFEDAFVDKIRIQDDGITSPSGFGDTTLEIDAIAVRKSVKKRLAGSIGDTVFLDKNRNAVQDIGESGMPGITVTLVGVGPLTTITNGYYLFDKLPAGIYTVQVQVPSGYENTTPTSYLINLDTGENYLDADFGLAPIVVELGSISGTVWDDSNMNGMQDASEMGISNVDVFIDVNGDGNLNPGEPKRTTDANGDYLFEDLPPGVYNVTVVVPVDYYPTTPTMLSVGLVDAEDITDVDFGLVQLGSVGDRVWIDSDSDGFQDIGEVGFSTGAAIHLDGSDVNGTEWHLNTISDGSGMYLFELLPPGTYTVTFTVPVGYLTTTTTSYIVGLDEDEDYLNADFGIVKPSPPKMGIWMSVNPISQKVGRNIAFSWEVLTVRPDIIPQKVELKLTKPDGTSFILQTYMNFPTDYKGTKTWTATQPTGTWWIWVTYYYTYLGDTYTAGTFGSFTVTP